MTDIELIIEQIKNAEAVMLKASEAMHEATVQIRRLKEENARLRLLVDIKNDALELHRDH